MITASRLRDSLVRAWRGDVLYSFRRSRIAMLAAAVTTIRRSNDGTASRVGHSVTVTSTSTPPSTSRMSLTRGVTTGSRPDSSIARVASSGITSSIAS